jgi:hypothetical protein
LEQLNYAGEIGKVELGGVPAPGTLALALRIRNAHSGRLSELPAKLMVGF